MRITRSILAAAALATGLSVVSISPAAAEEQVCRGSIGAVTLDNVRVPTGATCNLNGTSVEGTINVGRNATLSVNGAAVNGNVQAEGARSVRVAATEVGGSVQVVQSGAVQVLDSLIGSDIYVDSNRQMNSIRRNEVGGNVQAFQNTGGVAVFRNAIDGNLQCKTNRPRPTGGANDVQGSREDQCRSF